MTEQDRDEPDNFATGMASAGGQRAEDAGTTRTGSGGPAAGGVAGHGQDRRTSKDEIPTANVGTSYSDANCPSRDIGAHTVGEMLADGDTMPTERTSDHGGRDDRG